MADYKNELSDKKMSGAIGGVAVDEHKLPDYDAIGSVVMPLGGAQYQVRFDDGAELVAKNKSREEVVEGTKVGLFAIDGGWTMYVLANN
jgi:hypothetical protein